MYNIYMYMYIYIYTYTYIHIGMSAGGFAGISNLALRKDGSRGQYTLMYAHIYVCVCVYTWTHKYVLDKLCYTVG